MAVILLIVIFCVLYKPPEKQGRTHIETKEMEQVKEHIDRAYQLRTQLEQIDNMIIDLELVKPSGPCELRAVQMNYVTTAGKNAKVEIWFHGREKTEKMIEMLRAERAEICSSLYFEIENIPKRYRQNDDKTTET